MALTTAVAEWVYTSLARRRFLRHLTNRLLLHLTPKTIRIGEAELWLNPDDPVVSSAIAIGVFENDELAFFTEHIASCEEVFVDVGANIGLYSALAVHSLPSSATIVALEPHPVIFGWLERNVQRNRALRGATAPKVVLLPKAAAACSGKYKLHLNPDNSGDNRLYLGTFQGKVTNWETLSVSGVTLDEVFAEYHLGTVNFVKIDVQGFEQHVVQGFKETLLASQRVVLMTEFWPKGLQEAGGDAREYLRLLRALGFKLYELSSSFRGKPKLIEVNNEERLVHKLPERRYTNLVCVKSREPILRGNTCWYPRRV